MLISNEIQGIYHFQRKHAFTLCIILWIVNLNSVHCELIRSTEFNVVENMVLSQLFFWYRSLGIHYPVKCTLYIVQALGMSSAIRRNRHLLCDWRRCAAHSNCDFSVICFCSRSRALQPSKCWRSTLARQAEDERREKKMYQFYLALTSLLVLRHPVFRSHFSNWMWICVQHLAVD